MYVMLSGLDITDTFRALHATILFSLLFIAHREWITACDGLMSIHWPIVGRVYSKPISIHEMKMKINNETSIMTIHLICWWKFSLHHIRIVIWSYFFHLMCFQYHWMHLIYIVISHMILHTTLNPLSCMSVKL